MTTGRRNSDLGHIFSGDELRWHFRCDNGQCGYQVDGKGVRKAVVIRLAREHLKRYPAHHTGMLTAVVYQSIRAVPA